MPNSEPRRWREIPEQLQELQSCSENDSIYLNIDFVNNVIRNQRFIYLLLPDCIKEEDSICIPGLPKFTEQREVGHNTPFREIKPTLERIEQRFDFLDKVFYAFGWKYLGDGRKQRYEKTVPISSDIENWLRALWYYRGILSGEINPLEQLVDARNRSLFIDNNNPGSELWIEVNRRSRRQGHLHDRRHPVDGPVKGSIYVSTEEQCRHLVWPLLKNRAEECPNVGVQSATGKMLYVRREGCPLWAKSDFDRIECPFCAVGDVLIDEKEYILTDEHNNILVAPKVAT